MVYFCPVDEPMTTTEEMFSFVTEVLVGVCLKREELKIYHKGKYLV